MKRSALPDLIAFMLMLMFTYAAFSKLLSFETFKAQMIVQPVPRWSVAILIYAVPIAELLTVIALFIKKRRAIGFYSASFLMLSFTIYVGLALTGTYGHIPCSCGGIIRHIGWKWHLVFNIFFLLLSVLGIYMDYKERRFIGK